MKITIKNGAEVLELDLNEQASANFPTDLKRCLENNISHLHYQFSNQIIILPSEFLRNSVIRVNVNRGEDFDMDKETA